MLTDRRPTVELFLCHLPMIKATLYKRKQKEDCQVMKTSNRFKMHAKE